MTIIVVDRFRLSADTYGRIQDGGSERLDQGYRKIALLTQPVRYGPDLRDSHKCMAFTGNAMIYVNFLRHYVNIVDKQPTPPTEASVVKAMSYNPGQYRVIIPTPEGALVFDGQGVEHVVGDTLVFGGDHVESDTHTDKAWFMVFLDAHRAGNLPGLDVESTLYGTGTIESETLLDDDAAKEYKKRSRGSWLRRRNWRGPRG